MTYVVAHLPAGIVRGLLEGEAMQGFAEDADSVAVLSRAQFEQRGRGERAYLLATVDTVTHIAAYLDELADDWDNTLGCHDRFGFSRKQAGSAAERLRAQLP